MLPSTQPPLAVEIIPAPRAPSDMTDAEIGAAAAEAVDKHLSMRAGSIEYAIRAGELLREARRRCDEQGSSWSDWQRRYWTKSVTTAKRYMALALEVQGSSGPRADRLSALLALPSVRAALVDSDYDAGSTREIADMREPGADEDEDANVPTGERMEGPTPAEAATVARLSGQQAQADADRAAGNKQRRDDWRAQKVAEERREKEEETAEQKMARVAQAAADKARQAAELEAINAARDRQPGPEAPKPRPTPPAETLSVGPTCDAMEQLALSVQRRWADLRMEPAPKVEQYGREAMHPRDEAHDYVDEWVKQIPSVLRHLQNLKDEDVKVARYARKQRAGGAA